MTTFIIWILILFCDHRLIHKFYLSNLITIGFSAFALIYLMLYRTKDAYLPVLLGLWLVSSTVISFLQFGTQPNYIEELFKSILLLSGGIALSRIYSTETIEYTLKPFPVVLSIYLFIQITFIGVTTLPDQRFALYDSLGGPNTTGFILCVAIISLLTSYRAFSLLKWALVLFLSVLLVKTFSRSAILGLALGILFAIVWRRKEGFSYRDASYLLVLAAILAIFFIMYKMATNPAHPNIIIKQNIERFFLISDIKATQGSGRLTAWLFLLKLVYHTPKAWLTGFGPGLVPHLNLLNVHYPSIDSFIIKFIYSYGLIGFIVASLFCLRLIMIKSSSPHDQALKNMAGLFLVFTLGMNDTTSASQAILYGALLVALILSKKRDYF